MDDGDTPPADDGAEADFQALAEDWIAIWQSEITAFMTDPETQHAWGAMLALWAGAAQAMLRAMPPAPGYPQPARARPRKPKAATPHDAEPRQTAAAPAGPHAAPGPAPADAASFARDDEVRRLEQRVAELERHLADTDRVARSAGRHRGPNRPSRSRG